MDARQAIYGALRSRLTGNSALTDMVASSSITASYRQQPTTYPAIRMRIVGANGDTLDTFLGGDIFLNIYTKDSNAPAARLASIYNVTRSLIHDRGTAITTSNIGVGRIRETFVDYPLYEDEVPGGVYYLAARYFFVAQNRS